MFIIIHYINNMSRDFRLSSKTPYNKPFIIKNNLSTFKLFYTFFVVFKAATSLVIIPAFNKSFTSLSKLIIPDD